MLKMNLLWCLLWYGQSIKFCLSSLLKTLNSCSHILSTRTSDVEDFIRLQKSIFHIINLSISLQFIVNDLVLLGLKAN